MQVSRGNGDIDNLPFHIVSDAGKESVVVGGDKAYLYCITCTKMIMIGLATNCRHVRAVKKVMEGVG